MLAFNVTLFYIKITTNMTRVIVTTVFFSLNMSQVKQTDLLRKQQVVPYTGHIKTLKIIIYICNISY